MKKICTLLLTAGMLFGVATGASAVDFKAKGQWIFGFGAVDTMWNGQDGSDTFKAQQRIRLQVDAVASESLSGTVFFEMGETTWGNSGSGGALGADGKIVEVKRAYIDWYVPNTELNFRMGLQGLATPNAAGGAAILDDDVAAVVASYKFNDMVSLTFAWARPYNDNYVQDNSITNHKTNSSNYLDNIDLFLLSLPIKGENWSINPWVMYGAMGDESIETWDQSANNGVGGYVPSVAGIVADGLFPVTGGYMDANNGYTSMWFAGLPMSYQMDAWNFELDLNYGSVSYSGDGGLHSNMDTKRAGWLIKGLVEYKMDWGTPGLFAWYGSGDDDKTSNGSEMMPFINPCGNFTSFMGDGNELGWQPGTGYDNMLSYSGTWGIGLQLAKMSFMEDLSHTFRIAYWNGTNDSKNAVHVGSFTRGGNGSMYLTEDDYLVEFNLDSTYQIYENLQAVVQFGYIINGIDKDTWGNSMDNRRDAYKATLTFNYSF